MATKDKTETPSRGRREPLPEAKRKRLEKAFAHAGKQVAREEFDYAADLLAQCLAGDPSNLKYVQAFLENLQKKYKNNRKGQLGARFREGGARSAVKKAISKEQWDEVVEHGLKVLKINPWDTSVLRAMATAADKMGDDEPELYYLKCALVGSPKDVEVNRQTAKALGRRGLWDQAIARWHRVEEESPEDEEATREISRLTLEKTIVRGGLDEGDGSQIRQDDGPVDQEEVKTSREDRLKRRIKIDPADVTNYLELAQIYIDRSSFKEAAEVYAGAFEASDGDADIREHWEDVEIRYLEQQIAAAAKRGDKETEATLRQEHRQKGVEHHQRRCERYPNNLMFKYELGRRYQSNGQFNEAIQQYQLAKNDPTRKGRCLLYLGKCFQQVKQYKLALGHYEQAIAEISDRDIDNKKDTLYLAGRIAVHLGDLDRGEKHLSQVAGIDFTYKDVRALLDKISKMREDEGDPDQQIEPEQ